MADAISFLSPYEIRQVAKENCNVGDFREDLFYHKMYVASSH